ncbi:MAG: toxin-antitoxin system TumE family protein [Chloroflexota bacterium]
MNPFRSFREYEEYVYTLKQRFSNIQRSTLVVIRRGKRAAILKGEIAFEQGYRVTVQERLSFDTGTIEIESYGYEIWRNTQKIAWYDSQPHPDDPELESTYPHHKHIQPDIKHHRIPAPNVSFAHPNIPVLIGEVENLIARSFEIDNDPQST